MKKLLSFLLLTFMCVIINAQECNIQGVVQYEYNDYIGYKIDTGSEIGVVSVKKALELGVVAEDWRNYEKLAKQYMKYLSWKNDDELSVYGISTIRDITGFSIDTEIELKKYDNLCCEQYIKLLGNYEYETLVDGTGKYALTLPYGEYLIFAKSKNRQRPLSTELTGRILVEHIIINKPSKIISFDFCY